MSLGSWIPIGNCSLLGIHPSLGLQGGIMVGDVGFGFIIEPRFVRSWNDYTVVYNGKPVTTNNYVGGLVGLYLNKGIFEKQGLRLIGIGGWGIDGFTAVDRSPPKYPNPLSIGSQNLFVGVGLMLKRGKDFSSYYRIEVINSFIDYQNEGGTPLSGNAITVRFCLGGRMLLKQFLKEYKRNRGRMYGKW